MLLSTLQSVSPRRSLPPPSGRVWMTRSSLRSPETAETTEARRVRPLAPPSSPRTRRTRRRRRRSSCRFRHVPRATCTKNCDNNSECVGWFILPCGINVSSDGEIFIGSNCGLKTGDACSISPLHHLKTEDTTVERRICS